MLNMVFVGNCQADTLRVLYRKYVTPYAPANTFHVWSNRKISEASRVVLRNADVIVRQVQDFETEADLGDTPPGAITHLIPAVIGSFLWPFGGRAHPLNAAAKKGADGPYPPQLGDSFLNELIAKNVAPQEAVDRYLALDINSVVSLDRLYRIVMSRQRRMDKKTGFGVADVIETHFFEWRARLGPRRGMRIGIAWSGNPAHRDDHRRSIPLAQFAQLLTDRPDCEFHVLQAIVRDSDKEALRTLPHVHDHSLTLADFTHTAALISLMDVVISVDTSVAHLAGAMGWPVWLLLASQADWRWLLERDDTPWYPTFWLFRQRHRGDWDAVLKQVAQELDVMLT